MASFNYFARFLDRHRPLPLFNGAFTSAAGFVLCAFIAVMAFPLSPATTLITSIIGLAFASASLVQVLNRKKLGKPIPIPIDIREDIVRLLDFRERGELSSRAHPDALRILEEAASSRYRVLKLCETPKWNSSRDKDTLRQEIENTLNTALHDMIAVSRPLFRPKGGRTLTWKNRFADPNFGVRQLTAIQDILAELHALESSLALPEEMGTPTLSKLRERLAETERAEAELGAPPELFLDEPRP
jgi:hypothetical protein